MKKILLSAIILAGALFAVNTVSAQTLYNCFALQGQKWTSVMERAPQAASLGIWQYRGTAEQNTTFSDRLCGDPNLLGGGFSVATGYQKTLRVSMTKTQSFFYPSSLLLRDGVAISTSSLGTKIFFTVDPGKSKEEIMMCTGIDSTNTKVTGCTRGLAFSGTSVASVSGNRETHSSGAVVVMSNSHYVYEQFVDVNAKTQTIQGDKTATGTWIFSEDFPIIVSSGYSGLPTSDGEVATKAYVDSVGATGFTSANVASNESIKVFGTSPETIGVAVSTTQGMATSTGDDGSLYIKVQPTGGIKTGSDGLYFDTSTSTVNSGNHTWSGNSTSTGESVFSGTINMSGTVNISATALNITGTSTLATTTVGEFTANDINLSTASASSSLGVLYLRNDSNGITEFGTIADNYINLNTSTTRIINTYYYNPSTTTRSKVVVVGVDLTGADADDAAWARFFIGAGGAGCLGTTVIGKLQLNTTDAITMSGTMTAIIPPGHCYKVQNTLVSTGKADLAFWIEYSL